MKLTVSYYSTFQKYSLHSNSDNTWSIFTKNSLILEKEREFIKTKVTLYFYLFIMVEKKEAANWSVAATHYLTAGFVIPVICKLITYFLIIPFLYLRDASDYVIYLSEAVMITLGVFLWVIYSSNYIKKKYIIKSVDKVIELSSTYFFVIGILLNLNWLLSGNFDLIYVIFMILVVLINTPIFYIVSKKYLLEK